MLLTVEFAAQVDKALAQPSPERLQFILGTEAGMITSIVRKVQAMLRKVRKGGKPKGKSEKKLLV